MATTRTAASGVRAVAEAGGEMGAEMARIDQEVRAFVKERPVLALLGAITAGYLLGRILRRRG